MRRIILLTLVMLAAVATPVLAHGIHARPLPLAGGGWEGGAWRSVSISVVRAAVRMESSADRVLGRSPPASRRHTTLEASSPARDTMLDSSPSELRLTFNERIDPQLANVRLVADDGTAQPLGELIRGDSAQEIVAAVTAPLAPGRYTVEWRVVGADGHPVDGDYAFTVEPPPSAVAADTGDLGAVAPLAGPTDPGTPAPDRKSVV